MQSCGVIKPLTVLLREDLAFCCSLGFLSSSRMALLGLETPDARDPKRQLCELP